MSLPAPLAEVVADFADVEGQDKLALLLEFAGELPTLPSWLEEAAMEPVPECQSPLFLHVDADDADHVRLYFSAPAEYSGELLAPPGLSETAQRGGHIPGAKNIPWSQAVAEDGTFKPVEQLRELYQGKGITSDKNIVAYCRIGERSSHTWFVLKYLLGYENVRNYDGSWTEWGSVIGAPIEK